MTQKEIKTLTEKRASLRKMISDIDEQIEAATKAERLQEAQFYIGKCFFENESDEVYRRAVYVYAVDEKTCRPIALEARCYLDRETYYAIEDNDLIMAYLEDEFCKWSEIPRSEFDKIYNYTQGLIAKAIQ